MPHPQGLEHQESHIPADWHFSDAHGADVSSGPSQLFSVTSMDPLCPHLSLEGLEAESPRDAMGHAGVSDGSSDGGAAAARAGEIAVVPAGPSVWQEAAPQLRLVRGLGGRSACSMQTECCHCYAQTTPDASSQPAISSHQYRCSRPPLPHPFCPPHRPSGWRCCGLGTASSVGSAPQACLTTATLKSGPRMYSPPWRCWASSAAPWRGWRA